MSVFLQKPHLSKTCEACDPQLCSEVSRLATELSSAVSTNHANCDMRREIESKTMMAIIQCYDQGLGIPPDSGILELISYQLTPESPL